MDIIRSLSHALVPSFPWGSRTARPERDTTIATSTGDISNAGGTPSSFTIARDRHERAQHFLAGVAEVSQAVLKPRLYTTTMTNENTETRWEVFVDAADSPIGLLYRRWSSSELLTDIIFTQPEPHRITSRIELDERRWIHSSYVEDGHEPVEINAAELIEEEDAIPTYMEFFLLSDAVNGFSTDDEHTVSYHVLAPNDRHGIAQDASIWSPEEGLWEIETNGELASRHRVVDGAIVESDWLGVRSRPLSASEAVEQLRSVIDDDVLATFFVSET